GGRGGGARAPGAGGGGVGGPGARGRGRPPRAGGAPADATGFTPAPGDSGWSDRPARERAALAGPGRGRGGAARRCPGRGVHPGPSAGGPPPPPPRPPRPPEGPPPPSPCPPARPAPPRPPPPPP